MLSLLFIFQLCWLYTNAQDCFADLCILGFNSYPSYDYTYFNGRWVFDSNDADTGYPIYRNMNNSDVTLAPNTSDSDYYSFYWSDVWHLDSVLLNTVDNITCSSDLALSINGQLSYYQLGIFDVMTCEDFKTRNCRDYTFDESFRVDLAGALTQMNGEYEFGGCYKGMPTYNNTEYIKYQWKFNWNIPSYDLTLTNESSTDYIYYGRCFTGLYSPMDCFDSPVFTLPTGNKSKTIYQEYDIEFETYVNETLCVIVDSSSVFYKLSDGISGITGKYSYNGTLNGRSLWSHISFFGENNTDIYYENDYWYIGSLDLDEYKFKCAAPSSGTDTEQILGCLDNFWESADGKFEENFVIKTCDYFNGRQCIIGDTTPPSTISISGFDTTNNYSIFNTEYTLQHCSNGYPYYMDDFGVELFYSWTVGIPILFGYVEFEDGEVVSARARCEGYYLLNCSKWYTTDATLVDVTITSLDTTTTTTTPTTTAPESTTTTTTTTTSTTGAAYGGSTTTTVSVSSTSTTGTSSTFPVLTGINNETVSPRNNGKNNVFDQINKGRTGPIIVLVVIIIAILVLALICGYFARRYYEKKYEN